MLLELNEINDLSQDCFQLTKRSENK